MIIEYPTNFDIQQYENKFLWRYIDLYKLLDLITNNKIYFTRFDNFEDGLEGLTGEGIGLRHFTESTPVTRENVNKAFTESEQVRIVQKDEHLRNQYTNEVFFSQQTQFASCWFEGNKESIAMWKLYSQLGGIAVKFNAKELIESIIEAASNLDDERFPILYFGAVNYKNIWPFDINETFEGKFSGLKKDRSYSHESEFRFVSVVPIQLAGMYSHFSLKLKDISTFKMEIVTNPFMNDWQAGILETLLKKFNLESFLKRSKMVIKRNN